MSFLLPSTEVCGTDRGYQRHRYWRTTPCEPCLRAHREYERARRQRQPAPVRELVPCGSSSAYRRHLRRGEIACAECLAAHAANVARYPRKRSAA